MKTKGKSSHASQPYVFHVQTVKAAQIKPVQGDSPESWGNPASICPASQSVWVFLKSRK